MKQLQTSMALLIIVGVSAGGCVGPKRAAQFVEEGLEVQKGTPKAIFGLARSLPGSDQGIIDTYEGAFEQRMSAQTSRMTKIKEEIDQEVAAINKFLTELGAMAAEIAGTSTPGGTLIQHFMGAFAKTKENAETHAQSLVTDITDQIGQEIEEMDQRVVKLASEVLQLQKASTSEDKKLEFNDERLEARLNQRLAKLEGFDPEEFKKNLELEREKLAGLEGEALKAAVLKEAQELGLTEDQRKIIQDMTPSELQTALGAGSGGILGIFALARTFGRSRSQGQTDILNAQLNDVRDEVVRLRGGQTGSSTASRSGGGPPAVGGGGAASAG